MSASPFESLWQYNNWANDRLLTLLDSYGPKLPASSLRLMSHIFHAQTNWYNRMIGKVNVPDLWATTDLSTCHAGLKESADGIHYTMQQQKETEIIKYADSKGNQFETSLFDILLQVFNHATYHRAQIAQDLRINGLEPINTDYITYVRLTAPQ